MTKRSNAHLFGWVYVERRRTCLLVLLFLSMERQEEKKQWPHWKPNSARSGRILVFVADLHHCGGDCVLAQEYLPSLQSPHVRAMRRAVHRDSGVQRAAAAGVPSGVCLGSPYITSHGSEPFFFPLMGDRLSLIILPALQRCWPRRETARTRHRTHPHFHRSCSDANPPIVATSQRRSTEAWAGPEITKTTLKIAAGSCASTAWCAPNPNFRSIQFLYHFLSTDARCDDLCFLLFLQTPFHGEPAARLLLETFLTPNEAFYTCNHGPVGMLVDPFM